MPNTLNGVLAQIPGLAGYEAARLNNQNTDMANMGLLQKIHAVAQQQALEQEKLKQMTLDRAAGREATAANLAATLSVRDEGNRQRAADAAAARAQRIEEIKMRLAAEATAAKEKAELMKELVRLRAETSPAKTAERKAPTGFQWNKEDPNKLEPIPGGPKDTSAKDAAKTKAAIDKANIVIGKVDTALGKVGRTTTGLPGKVLSMVPGTDAYDLDKLADTIRANIGFGELQAMRDASPTGGALGQVALQELAMLQAVIASLDTGQSKGQVKDALDQIRTHYSNWKKAVEAAANPTPAPQPAPAPKPSSNRLRFDAQGNLIP